LRESSGYLILKALFKEISEMFQNEEEIIILGVLDEKSAPIVLVTNVTEASEAT
jgi:hypothetical protein